MSRKLKKRIKRVGVGASIYLAAVIFSHFAPYFYIGALHRAACYPIQFSYCIFNLRRAVGTIQILQNISFLHPLLLLIYSVFFVLFSFFLFPFCLFFFGFLFCLFLFSFPFYLFFFSPSLLPFLFQLSFFIFSFSAPLFCLFFFNSPFLSFLFRLLFFVFSFSTPLFCLFFFGSPLFIHPLQCGLIPGLRLFLYAHLPKNKKRSSLPFCYAPNPSALKFVTDGKSPTGSYLKSVPNHSFVCRAWYIYITSSNKRRRKVYGKKAWG